MACPPPEFDWFSWTTWSCLREDIAPIATFIAAVTVAWAALAQARTAHRRHEEQTKADRERRITESFAKAVEQLGSEKLETRLGAIYTLEDISRESERKYWPIMETLTAYVREHAPWPPRQSDGPADQEKESKPLREGIRPAADVQAILTVLGRREEWIRNQEGKDQCLNLSWTDLRGANLAGAHLERAHLGGAHLEHTNIWASYLDRAHLGGAYLEDANLWAAQLVGTCFIGAHLQGADLRLTHLKGAELERANLEGTDLLGAMGLTQAQLNKAWGDEETRLPKGLTRPGRWAKPA